VPTPTDSRSTTGAAGGTGAVETTMRAHARHLMRDERAHG